MEMSDKPIVKIEYCRKCKWMIRAAWMAQECLSTFEDELGGVTISPGNTDAMFDISIDGELLWSRNAQGRMPGVKEFKRLIRDHVAPGRNLGHIDKD